jgi:hypothetical protein
MFRAGFPGVLAAASLAGCLPHLTHPTLAQQYGAAVAVAIAPPSVTVYSVGGGMRQAREDWSQTGYQNLSRALQASFEARRFEVVWASDPPEEAGPVSRLASTFLILLPGLQEAARAAADASFTSRPALPRLDAADVGELLEAADCDLLVLADGGEDVLTAEGVVLDLLLAFLGKEMDQSATWLRVAVVDRTGQILYFGTYDGGGGLLGYAGASSAVESALGSLPRR